MSKQAALKDSKLLASRCSRPFSQVATKSAPSSNVTTPEPANPGPSTPDTPIPGHKKLLEPLTPLATTKDETPDVKFALLDSPSRPPLQIWPIEVVTKQGRTENRSLVPQQLVKCTFVVYSMIEEAYSGAFFLLC